jgi:LuxR family transcriptional regulator, quorum-sensing system regulator SdiA
MQKNINIMKSLSDLDQLCSAGYAIALHISYTTPKFLFQTYNRKWMETYSQQGLVLKDPTVLWGFENDGSIRWDALADLDTAGVLSLARQFGIAHGFTFATNQNDSRSIASFARNDRESSESEIAEISRIVRDLHDYTAEIDGFSPEEMAQLKNMSVAFTRG